MSSNNEKELMQSKLKASKYFADKDTERSAKYKDHKANPFAYSLGFLSVSVLPDVIEGIKNRNVGSRTPGDSSSKEKLAWILFGIKKNPVIEISQSFYLNDLDSESIHLEGGHYGVPELEFLGLSWEGEISDVDISSIKPILKKVKKSLFLFFIESSASSDDLIMYESVYDIHWISLKERILMEQLFKYPKDERSLNRESKDVGKDFHWHIATVNHDIEVNNLDPNNTLFKEVHANLLKSESIKNINVSEFQPWFSEGLDSQLQKKKIICQALQDVCNVLNVEVTYVFLIYEDLVLCLVKLLDTFLGGNDGLSINESHVKGALNALDFVLRPVWKTLLQNQTSINTSHKRD